MRSGIEQEQPTTGETPVADTPRFSVLLGILWRRRWWVLKCTAAGFMLAVLLAFLLPRRFESKAQIMPPEQDMISGTGMLAAVTGGVGPPSVAAGLANNFLANKSPGAIYVGILQSRTVQDDLINRFDLRKVYWCKTYRSARKKLAARTNIEEQKSGIITISVADHDPDRARDMVRVYVEELGERVAGLSTSSARRERIFLEERLKIIKEELDQASVQLGQFSSRNATFDVQNQAKAMMDSAGRLQAELIAAESELRGLETIYTDNNVRVRSVRARVAELQLQLRKMNVGPGNGKDDDQGVATDSTTAYPPLRQLPMLAVKYSDLLRRTKIREAVYEILSKQYEVAKVQEAKEVASVKVLDAPDLPEKATFPPVLIILVLGLACPFLGASAWALVQARWLELQAADPSKVALQDIAQEARSDIRQFLARLPFRRARQIEN